MGIPTRLPDGVLAAGDTTLAEGRILVGNASGVASALSGLTSGQVLVGNGTTLTSVAISNDATLSAAGSLTIAANSVEASMVEDALIQYVDVQLTNAQMTALRATPIQLVATPGANLLTLVHRVYAVSSAAAGAWTETADNLRVQYATSPTAILTLESTGFIDQADVQIRTQAPATTVLDLTGLANQAVQLQNDGDGELGGGNAASTFSIRVYYSIVDAIAFT